MAYMSNVFAVRDSKGKLIDYGKRKKNNKTNLEKKFNLLNQKMKMLSLEYKLLQKQLKSRK